MHVEDSPRRLALVSGGSGAIGEAICRRLAREGWTVAVGYVTESRAVALATALRAAGGESLAVPLDMADSDVIRRTVDRLLVDFGVVRGLVLNAGLARAVDFVDSFEGDWNELLDVNLRGPVLATELCLPAMVARGGGAVVAVTSEAAKVGDARHACYAAGKAALFGYLEATGRRLAPAGVRASAVAPGPIDTALLRSNGADAMAKLARLVPLGRLGRPEEIAGAVSLLLSDAGAALAGVQLSIGGGVTMNDA